MEPRAYITAYLERTYLAGHTDLTDAARELVHADVARRPEKYAGDEHGRALIAYLQIHERLMNRLGEMDDLPDGEFETRCAQLFSETRAALYPLYEGNRQVVDAGTLAVLLADASVDDRLHDLLTIERSQREHLEHAVHGIDLDAPSFWSRTFLDETGSPAERLTAAEPALVGWLHLLEAISTLCMASARYRAAIEYSRTVMRAQGYPNHAEGTAFLALARLEEEDAFFALARELGDADAQKVDDSPWYLLGRALLLYKLGRERPARRALREFASRCDGGAFFLLNPTYHAPYLPVRPVPRESWELTHQAVWEADGIIDGTPDFVPWAEGVGDIRASADSFAARNGF